MIKDDLNTRSGAPLRAKLLALLVLSFSLALLPGCVSKARIRASLWLNNGLPADLCASEPRLREYGFYRKLNSGEYEFLAFCSAQVQDMFAITKDDLEAILKETLPKEKGSKFVQSVVNWHKPVEGHIPAIVQESGGQ